MATASHGTGTPRGTQARAHAARAKVPRGVPFIAVDAGFAHGVSAASGSGDETHAQS